MNKNDDVSIFLYSYGPPEFDKIERGFWRNHKFLEELIKRHCVYRFFNNHVLTAKRDRLEKIKNILQAAYNLSRSEKLIIDFYIANGNVEDKIPQNEMNIMKRIIKVKDDITYGDVLKICQTFKMLSAVCENFQDDSIYFFEIVKGKN